MDLSLTETQEMFRNTMNSFIRREVPTEELVKLRQKNTGYTQELWQKVADMGLLGVIIPEEYGGVGESLTTSGIMFEELGRGPFPGPHLVSGILCSSILLAAGSEEQKKAILPPVASGEHVVTLALNETDYGWTPASIKITAAKTSNGLVLNGTKLFVPYGCGASHFICPIRSGDSGPEEITLLLVEKNTSDLSIREMSGPGTWFAEISFKDTEVPETAIIGKAGAGWQAIEAAMQRAIPVFAAYQLGGCRSVLAFTLQYASIRHQFGQAIGKFQRVQDHIIDIVNHLDAAYLTVYQALWQLDSGQDATAGVHVSKAVTSEAYYQSCNLSHLVHGGIGYADDYPLLFHTRMSRLLYDYLGNPGYHRQQLAKVLGFRNRADPRRQATVV